MDLNDWFGFGPRCRWWRWRSFRLWSVSLQISGVIRNVLEQFLDQIPAPLRTSPVGLMQGNWVEAVCRGKPGSARLSASSELLHCKDRLNQQVTTLMEASLQKQRRTMASSSVMITHIGRMGLCRFFQMIPAMAAMMPRTTSVTVTAMTIGFPTETEKNQFAWVVIVQHDTVN